ncbi:hypothetical protein [Pseudomonas aeruginosa]|uniref:hypothetical protein n=1 Tax=Pseudomonas aeruginosa TaxID=287 RepID=UPI004046D2E6
MEKRDLENRVLELSMPLLLKLYGRFEVDESQSDRPDAAIDVIKPHKRFGKKCEPFKVGVEITTVDKKDSLAYLNDEKFGKEKLTKQISDSIDLGIDSEQPNKKIDIEIPKSYIYDGVAKKREKHASYVSLGKFKEIILICFSDVISSNNVIFKNGLMGWSNRLLSQNEFPFDKVIFVDFLGGTPIRIYDKNKPLPEDPRPYIYGDSSITVTQGPFMRVGETYNLNKINSAPPLITPKAKR